jgi:WD40 repeat protein
MRELGITPSRTVVTSFNPRTTAASQSQAAATTSEDYFERGDWVLRATACPNQWVSCALSNGEIQVYDQERLHLQQTYKVDNHNQTHLITDLVGDCSSSNPHTLAATSSDGTLTLFDIRQPIPTFQLKLPRAEEKALSVSIGYDGSLAAVGSSKARAHFFDLRGRALLGTYSQAHTDEVTQVRFQPLSGFGTTTTTSSILVSAAEDGLACVFDTSQATEEAALKNILTVQSPIRQVGFFGPQSEAIYCLTGSESLKLWHLEDTTCRKDYGPQFRHDLGQLWGANSSAASTPMEYLVNCHWDISRQELLLLAGSSNGDAGVFKVMEQDVTLSHRLSGGHRGVIRSWSSLSTNVFVTVGEDARLCEWNRLGRQMHAANSLSTKNAAPVVQTNRFSSPLQPAATNVGGGRLRKQRNRMSASPY